MANETMLLTKVAQALKAVVTAAAVGTDNLYLQKYPGEKLSPSVNFGAAKTPQGEDPIGSGNFWVEAEVSVNTLAALDANGTDPTPASDLLTANVFAALDVDDLAAKMMAAVPQLTVFGFGIGKDFEQTDHGDHWRETWRRQIYCCGKVFS